MRPIKRIIAALILLSPFAANAVPIYSTGDGSAVTNVERIATFDGLNASGQDLSAYAEDGINIFVPDTQ